jgi:GTP-binding protein HflX
VFNKTDLADPGKLARLRALYPEAEFIAAARGEGLGRLQERLADFFDRALRPVRLLFPYAAAADMHRLRGIASDVQEEHTPDGVIFSARLPVAEAGRYARYSLDSTVVDVDDALDADDELPGSSGATAAAQEDAGER